jgi:hypothetical protein
LFEHLALGFGISGEGGEESAEEAGAFWLVEEGEDEGAAGGLVDGAGEAVEMGGLGIEDLLDAVDLPAFEDGGKDGAGAGAITVVEGGDDASVDPVGEEGVAIGGDGFVGAENALSEEEVKEFFFEVGGFQAVAFWDGELEVEAFVFQLAGLGGDGEVRGIGGAEGLDLDDDGVDPGVLGAEGAVELRGDLVAAGGEAAADA